MAEEGFLIQPFVQSLDDLDQSILLTPIGFDLEFVKFGVVAAPSAYLLFLLGLVAISFSKQTAHGDWRNAS